MKPYPDYKDSGVEWLEKLPEHWEMRRTKTVLRERSLKGFPDEPLLAATQTKGVVRKEQYENRTVLAMKDLHLLKLVRAGDFVISLRSFQGGIEYAREQGIISPAYTILFTDDPDDHGFLAHLFKSKPYIENLGLFVTGIRQGQNIDYEKLSRSRLPLPPLPEQAAIVRYLDHVDRRVRRLVRAKRKLIALLTEQRQAIIHRAVTRGLDPDVPLKDSGVEWLGQVPEHWGILRLKHLVRLKSGNGITAMSINKSGEFPVYGGNGLRGYTSDFTHDGNYVIIGRQGALCGNVNYANGKFWASEHAVVASPIRQLQTTWLGEMIRCMNLNQYSISAAQPGLSMEFVGNLYTGVPPVDEQTAMVEHFEAATATIDIAIARALREIDLLNEYRTRLIADVVTGKLDVCKAAATLPEVDPLDIEDEAEDLDEAETMADDLEKMQEEVEI
jgi:type I restriction enzyme S subunit